MKRLLLFILLAASCYGQTYDNLPTMAINSTTDGIHFMPMQTTTTTGPSYDYLAPFAVACYNATTKKYYVIGCPNSGGTPYVLPPATTSSLGGVIPDGTSIKVDSSGHISSPLSIASGYCAGAGTSSVPRILLGGFGSKVGTCTDGNETIGFAMPFAAPLSNLVVRCATTGVSSLSGVFNVVDIPVGSSTAVLTGITLTYGMTAANTAMFDNTHTFAASAGDIIQIGFSTQASETLGNCSASIAY